MKNCKHITGALLLNTLNGTKLDEIPHFSPDQACPNRQSDYYTGIDKYENCKYIEWNHGQGIFFNDWGDFPIFMVKDEESIHTLMDKCFLKYNVNITEKFSSNYEPICSAQMIFEMYAVKDKATCMRRGDIGNSLTDSRQCMEIGDNNIWFLLKPTNKSKPLKARSMVLLATRMDALTMFDDIAPAAESAVLSVITMLIVAEALARTNAENAIQYLDKNVMFMFFNGESYDYIGSTNLVYDMNIGQAFPKLLDSKIVNQSALINTSHISHFIEIGQVGLANHLNYYIHADPLSRKKHGNVDKEIKHMSELLALPFPPRFPYEKINVKPVKDKDQPLPPSSLQSFLKTDDFIPGIYIADHEREFENRFYHSILDNLNTIRSLHGHASDLEFLIDSIHGLSINLANFVYRLIKTNDTVDPKERPIEINRTLIYDLIDCFLVNSSCKFWKQFSNYVSLDPRLPSLSYYVSVRDRVQPYTQLTQLTLAYLTVNNIDSDIKTQKECFDMNIRQSIYSYIWFPSYIGLHDVSNKQYPACAATLTWSHKSALSSPWVESTWSGPASLRLYFRPNRRLDYAILAVGLSFTGLALVFSLFFTRYADTLFTTPADSRERESDASNNSNPIPEPTQLNY
ncbi:unnamed protein product [Gordionus sp. m RMFG-2023]